jgi:hypothetical protein
MPMLVVMRTSSPWMSKGSRSALDPSGDASPGHVPEPIERTTPELVSAELATVSAGRTQSFSRRLAAARS